MRRKDERGVSPVIATILMVAITVVLAAVLYVMVTALIIQPPLVKPSVVLDNPNCAGSACTARIATVSRPVDLGQFRVTVTANGATAIPPTTLVAGSDITGGGLTFRYTDLGQEGRMTGGDTFRLGGIATGVSYEVSFLWSDGTLVSQIALPS